MNVDDPLWPEFHPLWNDIKAHGDNLQVAGGYGLFLKQNWLRRNSDIRTIVQLDRWTDSVPRVTKDIDLVIGVELIARQIPNTSIADTLKRHDYKPTLRNPNWQFEKVLSEGRRIVVDLHAPLPEEPNAELSVDRIRVKRIPSLGEAGIHGRTNPEAVGSEIHPFRFEYAGVDVEVPNAVTWSLMKLTAMRDSFERSREDERPEDDRNFLFAQAIKHARDVCRVVALVNADERDKIEDVRKKLDGNAAFTEAKQIYTKHFADAQGFGRRASESMLVEEDSRLVCDLLGEWYR